MKKLALAAVLAAGMASSASAQATPPILGGLSTGGAIFAVVTAIVLGTVVSGETSSSGTN